MGVCVRACPGSTSPDKHHLHIWNVIYHFLWKTTLHCSPVDWCWLIFSPGFIQRQGAQNRWTESGKSKYSKCKRVETKTEKRNVGECRKPVESWKETGLHWWEPGCPFLSVDACVWGVSEGSLSGATRGQRTKNSLNVLIWFACRAKACLPSSNTTSWSAQPGFPFACSFYFPHSPFTSSFLPLLL